MAFLTLQDWTVPISRGGRYAPTESSDRRPAFDGTPLQTLTGHKRRWTFESAILEDDEAEGLIGILQGKGDKLKFDESVWSDKGEYPDGTPVATIAPAVDLQATPASVYDEDGGELEAKFGDGSLWVAPGVTNLLTSDTADAENAPVGYTSRGSATLAAGSVDGIFMQGSNSTKVTTGASTNSGAQGASVVVAGNTTYTFSVHVYSASALSLRLFVADTGSTSTSKNFTTVAGGWVRVEVQHVSSSASPTITVQVFQPANSAGNVFYCDMWQLADEPYGTPWADGGTTRAAPDLNYGDMCSNSDSLTFAAWVRGPSTERAGANQALFVTDDGLDIGGDFVILRRDSGSNDIELFISGNDGVSGSTNLSYTTSPWDGTWHHVAFTLRAREDGTAYAALYYDGTRVAQDTSPTHYPRLRGTQTNCFIANNDGANTFDGRMSEVFVLPFPMSDDQVAALAGRTTALPQYPKLEAAGDFNMSTDYDPEIVEGMVERSNYDGSVKSSTYHNNNRRVSFALDSEGDI